jgi:hypothetical protein
MTLQEIIKHYIPDLKEAELQESVGGLHFFKVYRHNNSESYQNVCLYEIDDYAPTPLAPIHEMGGIEDSFGLPVEGSFVVGSGKVLSIEQLESNPKLLEQRDFYFDGGDNEQGYLLYLLSSYLNVS